MPLQVRHMRRMLHGMATSDELLLALARAYKTSVSTNGGGRSLARVATVVLNRGSFFTSLERGSTCSTRNFDKLIAYFADNSNWPSGQVPSDAKALLASVGTRSAVQPTPESV